MIALFALAVALQQPQQAYFQQGVDYRIEARLNDSTGVLNGRARVRYTNNSSSTLDTLYFHLHLNAFRPNSAWARRELQFNNRRFTDIGPAEHAYERLRNVQVGGRTIRPVFPGAPDSTVVAFPLPQPLRPGQTTTVVMDWDARASTTPRRQGRRGRHNDFAQWYPRIAVFDRGGWQVQPLLPQGEFYGEFATYDVTLDVAADQVMGATGVPVEGDPGWANAAAAGTRQPVLRRDVYKPVSAEPLGFLDNSAAAGRKRVRWRAEDVIHFGWSTSPDYIYEGGQHDSVAIHVLYQPGDTAWDEGVAVQRTAKALEFLGATFAPYPYPQVTNVHRIESGGTEFPMMIMDGSASQGLILHEVGHIYLHGILANNEWREGWLDEGFVSFIGGLFDEAQGVPEAQIWDRQMELIVLLDKENLSQPISMKSSDFRDFNTYNMMTYTKPSLVLRMLRDVVGDSAMYRALRDYYARNKFHHVTEADLKDAFERASGQDLDWFFREWIHTTGKLDYAVTSARTRQLQNGQWQTTVEVRRTGQNYMPVTLQVGGATRRLESREPIQTVTVQTPERPTEAVLDPRRIIIDINPANNRAAVN